MDTTLVMVTLLSLGMAGALSVIVWRMLRDDRQRSDARVAALATLAARPEPAPLHGAPLPGPRVAARRPVDLDLPIRDVPMRAAASASAPATGDLFVERREEESPWRNRAVVMAALALVIASAVLFTLAANGRVAPRPSPRSVPTAAAPAAPAPAAQAELELVSLHDTRNPGSLSISGMVHNPRGGGLLSRVTVTAYAFDENGGFLASGRALLDVTSLAAGDESPFVVSVPVTDKVARYRIGFRGEDGRVIAHVDKRQQGPVASNW